ncbi:hypothetical protein LINPERHAP1_LOCUS28138 [Linum perenne]
MILEHYLIVQHWDLSFSVSSKVSSKMIVWVRFPYMPIGNLIGKMMDTEYNTQIGKFARIVIKIDLNEPLVPSVDLDGFWQRI